MTIVQPRIAVVDDEAAVRTMLRRVLRLADYDVETFASGDDFLCSIATRRPDCAVLDVHMPGLSGLEVNARLRAMPLPVPAVFISASDEPGLDQIVGRVGATLLRKPFPSQALLDAVAAALLNPPGERR